MTLQEQLDAFRAQFAAKVDADVKAVMARSEQDLAASGFYDRALKRGDEAPDFALPDVAGRAVRLSDLLRSGPAVVSFYRGGWCPYCNLELRALEAALPSIRSAGGSLVAISPQTPDHSLSTAEKNALTFPVLSDVGSRVATAFGVAFELDDALKAVYDRFGHALPSINGDGRWVLPAPATYVIDADARIALAHVDVDYRTRIEPDAVVAALRALKP